LVKTSPPKKKKRIAKPIIKVGDHTYYHSDIKPRIKREREAYISPDGLRMNEVAAAKYLGLKPSTLQNRRCRRHEPKSYKAGRAVYYLKTDLDDYLKANLKTSAKF
jgi:hypothetical protein